MESFIFSGVPKAAPGSGRCGKVSCSYNSAVDWCNDHHEGIELANFAWVAEGARIIHDKCRHQDHADWLALSNQAFNHGNWNVIVRSDYNNC